MYMCVYVYDDLYVTRVDGMYVLLELRQWMLLLLLRCVYEYCLVMRIKWHPGSCCVDGS